MSWGVHANGKPEEARMELSKLFSAPLAPAPAGLADEGERKTVRLISEMIEQCLGTFDPEKKVSVDANGHMGFQNYDKKTGAYQNVNISIKETA